VPYYISKKHPECESGWATVKSDYEIITCHSSRAAAIRQMVALSIAEDIPPGGTHPRDERQESEVTTRARQALWPEGYYGTKKKRKRKRK
jgi:hypothetical protein